MLAERLVQIKCYVITGVGKKKNEKKTYSTAPLKLAVKDKKIKLYLYYVRFK